MTEFDITVANEQHIKYADEICELIADSAKKRGTGIARRTPEYISQKMREGKAIIALSKKREFAGFCYIESWGADKKFAANSGLIVAEQFRNMGLAMRVKRAAFELSRKKFPDAKLFGLTTSMAVMKINSELGYRPVAYSELTDDDEFWKGCESCVNHDILLRTNRRFCLCTGMLYDPKEKTKNTRKKFKDYQEKYRQWLKAKRDYIFAKFRKDIVNIWTLFF